MRKQKITDIQKTLLDKVKGMTAKEILTIICEGDVMALTTLAIENLINYIIDLEEKI